MLCYDIMSIVFLGEKNMIIVFVIILFFLINGDRSNRYNAKQLSKIKRALVIFGILSFFSGDLIFLPFLAPVLVPVVVIVLAILKKNKQNNFEKTDNYYFGSVNQKNDASGKYYGYAEAKQAQSKSANAKQTQNILPKAASKRRKIIEQFNKKYNLTLTESQIQRMVDASYYSGEWEKEIFDMTKEYASVYEWFQGDTAWLRAYLKAFEVQSVSSDFMQQEQICFSEYDQIFSAIDFKDAFSQEHAIKKINEMFFTGFDDISFMIAYRFLEKHGRKYELTKTDVIKNESEIDVLAKKYQSMPSH